MTESPFDISDNVFNVNYESQDGMLVPASTNYFTTATLHVPAGCKEKYQQAAGWKDFQNIVEDAEEPELVVTGIDIEGNGIVGTPHTYTVHITNQGHGDFSGSVYVWTKEEKLTTPILLSSGYGTIGAGKRVYFQYVIDEDDGEDDHFYFTSPGTYHFWLTIDAEGQQPIEGEKVFVVTPAATLTAKSYTREYGEENPEFGFTADKGGFNGTPEITCAATKESPAGTYPIVIAKGSVDNDYVTYVNGTLTIEKAYQSLIWEQDFVDVEQYSQVELSAEATSGLPVEYHVNDESVCAVNTIGNKCYLDCFGLGETIVYAVQNGDSNWWQTTKSYKMVRIINTSGINTIANNGSEFDVFSANGQMIRKGTNNLIGLPKGIYIVNGRRVVVK